MNKVRALQSNDLQVIASNSIARPANTTAYAAGDAISEVTSDAHFTFSLGNVTKLSGTIKDAMLISSGTVATALDGELYLFAADVTDVADNAAFTFTDAQATANLIGVIDFATGDAHVTAANTMTPSQPNLSFTGATRGSGAYEIYGQLVARNAYVPESGETFTVKLNIAFD